MIRAELRLKPIHGMAERGSHHSGIGDDYVKGFAFCEQLIGAGPHTLHIGKIQLNQFESSTAGCRILSHLAGRRFCLLQIPRGAYDVRSMGSERARRFYTKSRRSAGD